MAANMSEEDSTMFPNSSDIYNSTFGNETTEVRHEDIFKYVTEGVLLTIVSSFGLVGNTMSIIVLTRASGVVRQGGASFSKLLRGLASFDALFLFIAIISFGFPQLSRWYARHIFLYITPIMFGLLHTFRVGSVYVTLAVTFERFHAIICPLKHFSWKKYLLPASVLIAVFYNIPKYFEMEIKTDPETGDYYIETSTMRQNPLYMSLYVFWSKFIFIELIPYVTIMVLNIFIIVKITKSAKFRKQFQRHDEEEYMEEIEANDQTSQRGSKSAGTPGSSGYCKVLVRLVSSSSGNQTRRGPSSTESVRQLSTVRGGQPRRTFLKKQQEEHTLGWILIGMSALFIFCQSFKIIPDLYEMVICNRLGRLGHNCAVSKQPVVNVITRMSHLLVCFNSSANFLIYYLNGEKFRRAWVETYGDWCCCYCSNPATSSPVNMHTQRTEIPFNGLGSNKHLTPPRILSLQFERQNESLIESQIGQMKSSEETQDELTPINVMTINEK